MRDYLLLGYRSVKVQPLRHEGTKKGNMNLNVPPSIVNSPTHYQVRPRVVKILISRLLNFILFLFLLMSVRFQVSDVSNQMTENRKQRTVRVFHPPVFTMCFLSSGLCPLKPEH